MSWLLAAVLCVGLVEFALRLRFGPVLSQMIRLGARAARTVRVPGVSDHWKEKAMGAYALRTLANTGRLGGLLLALFGSAALLALLFTLVQPGFMEFLLSLPGLLFTLVFASAYAWLRLRLRGADGSDYSALDRILHGLALGLTPIAEMSFDLERARLPDPAKRAARENPHVFVAGLARAGTTVLMRRLHASGGFRSLTYRDMPFVLAPGLWRTIARHDARAASLSERAHGDDLQVSVDSPEALEEPFWRLMAPDYIAPDHLRPHHPDAETLEAFRDHVAAILAAQDPGGPMRYLSKNNNNILRLSAIREAFPSALILIPFRAPLEHAASLQRQHENFVTQQAADRFIGRYMGWLAHFEFGAGHRPFRMGGSVLDGDPAKLDYWLALWCDVYEALLANAPADAVFVSYEALCEQPETWERIARAAGIPAEAGAEMAFAKSPRGPKATAADPALLARAEAVHARLRSR